MKKKNTKLSLFNGDLNLIFLHEIISIILVIDKCKDNTKLRHNKAASQKLRFPFNREASEGSKRCNT